MSGLFSTTDKDTRPICMRSHHNWANSIQQAARDTNQAINGFLTR